MATVTYDHATRFYANTERPAVDSLNLDIADGEFLVLVGPPDVASPPRCACSPAWRKSTKARSASATRT